MEQLHIAMPDNNSNGTIYSLNGDLEYPQSPYLLGGFRNVVNGTDEAHLSSFQQTYVICSNHS